MLSGIEVFIEALIAFIVAVTKLPEFNALITAIDGLLGQTPPVGGSSPARPPFSEPTEPPSAQPTQSAQSPARSGIARRF